VKAIGSEPTLEPDRARKLLESERERIARELADLRSGRDGGDGELSAVDQHPADAGTELFEEERDQSLIERLQRDLEAIERAFARLEEGTYGVSVESGKPIPDGRLEAVPWAERTVEEQATLEAQQRNSG
jgi:DnaK suppressor protein